MTESFLCRVVVTDVKRYIIGDDLRDDTARLGGLVKFVSFSGKDPRTIKGLVRDV